MGFAFKANTNDTRESSSIQICKDLLEEGAQLLIHDPKVEEKQISMDLSQEPVTDIDQYNESNLIKSEGIWCKYKKYDDCFQNVDAVLILTEWKDYAKIDWVNASKSMRHPAWVFDARSIVDPENILKTKINFWRIGDGSIYQSLG